MATSCVSESPCPETFCTSKPALCATAVEPKAPLVAPVKVWVLLPV